MEAILGKFFHSNNGQTDELSIKNSKIVCLFFSASYCPPCIGFTPLLIDFYNDVNAELKQLEIVLVPKCRTEADFNAYFKDQPWLSIPYGDPRVEDLIKRYEIKGIPALIVLKPTGEPIKNGRQDVVKMGSECFVSWLEKIQASESANQSQLDDIDSKYKFYKAQLGHIELEYFFYKGQNISMALFSLMNEFFYVP